MQIPVDKPFDLMNPIDFIKLGMSMKDMAQITKIALSADHSRRKAAGLILADGRQIEADYVICACDTNQTFEKLIDIHCMPKKLAAAYHERENYPVFSGFNAAFVVDSAQTGIDGTLCFDCEKFTAARQTVSRLGVRDYCYDRSLVPAGKTVLQTQILQYEADYDYWRDLYADRERYESAKNKLAEKIKTRLETHFPHLKGKLHLLDTWTPLTYTRYTNAWKGAYMSFGLTPRCRFSQCSGSIRGIANVQLAGQWLMPPGGLPGAAATGKFAVQRIVKNEKRKFTT